MLASAIILGVDLCRRLVPEATGYSCCCVSWLQFLRADHDPSVALSRRERARSTAVRRRDGLSLAMGRDVIDALNAMVLNLTHEIHGL